MNKKVLTQIGLLVWWYTPEQGREFRRATKKFSLERKLKWLLDKQWE